MNIMATIILIVMTAVAAVVSVRECVGLFNDMKNL